MTSSGVQKWRVPVGMWSGLCHRKEMKKIVVDHYLFICNGNGKPGHANVRYWSCNTSFWRSRFWRSRFWRGTDVMWCKIYTDTDKLNIPQSSTKKHANFLLFFSNVYPFPCLIDLLNIYRFSLLHSLLISTVIGRHLLQIVEY